MQGGSWQLRYAMRVSGSRSVWLAGSLLVQRTVGRQTSSFVAPSATCLGRVAVSCVACLLMVLLSLKRKNSALRPFFGVSGGP